MNYSGKLNCYNEYTKEYLLTRKNELREFAKNVKFIYDKAVHKHMDNNYKLLKEILPEEFV